MHNHCKTMALVWLGALSQLFLSTKSSAAISEQMRNTYLLGETMWTEQNSWRDRDNDGLKDDFEPRIADVWKPYFIYDEHENNGANTSELSLQSWEPRIVFQVHPLSASGSEVLLRITYGILYRMDGGFRNDFWCTNYHSGDTEQLIYYVRSHDSGVSWRLEAVLGFDGFQGAIDAGDTMLEWTPISGDFERPRLRVYSSAGKHHPYANSWVCEDWGVYGCDDDCSSGPERMANLHPWEYYTNVGEPGFHPMDWGLNQPFVNSLWHIGYPNESTWGPAWHLDGCGFNGDVFTGGMNSGPNNTGAWAASGFPQGDTCVRPVYGLFFWPYQW
jgi:hypothetical protein